jgi:hypothetical protein
MMHDWGYEHSNAPIAVDVTLGDGQEDSHTARDIVQMCEIRRQSVQGRIREGDGLGERADTSEPGTVGKHGGSGSEGRPLPVVGRCMLILMRGCENA